MENYQVVCNLIWKISLLIAGVVVLGQFIHLFLEKKKSDERIADKLRDKFDHLSKK